MATARHWLRTLAALARQWRERQRSRHALASLDDYRLRDITLTRAEVQREVAKWFWRS